MTLGQESIDYIAIETYIRGTISITKMVKNAKTNENILSNTINRKCALELGMSKYTVIVSNRDINIV